MDESMVVGRVLQASTTRFTVGCQPPIASQRPGNPRLRLAGQSPFGRRRWGNRDSTAWSTTSQSRMTSSCGSWWRQAWTTRCTSPTSGSAGRCRLSWRCCWWASAVAPQSAGAMTAEPRHYLPPQPPNTLDKVYSCISAEVVRFTARHDWLGVPPGRPRRWQPTRSLQRPCAWQPGRAPRPTRGRTLWQREENWRGCWRRTPSDWMESSGS